MQTLNHWRRPTRKSSRKYACLWRNGQWAYSNCRFKTDWNKPYHQTKKLKQDGTIWKRTICSSSMTKLCNIKTRQSRRNHANIAQDQLYQKINSGNPLGNQSLLTTNPGNCQQISKNEKAYKGQFHNDWSIKKCKPSLHRVSKQDLRRHKKV